MAGAGALAGWHLAGKTAIGSPQRAGGAATLREPWITPSEAKAGSTYHRIKTYLDLIPAIDMHEHLKQFDELSGYG